MRNAKSFAVIVGFGFIWTASIHASRPVTSSRISDKVTAAKDDTRTEIVAKPLVSSPLLQIENLRLVSPPAKAPQPSALLKFDVLNDTMLPLTDVVMRVSFLEKRPDQVDATPPRVVVGPVTIRVDEALEAGHVLSYEMLFRNLSPECNCSPRVEILSARLVPD